MLDSAYVEPFGDFGLSLWAPEFCQVAKALHGLVAGDQARVLVEGPIGSGKTYVAGLPMVLARGTENWLYLTENPGPEVYRDVRNGTFDLIICDNAHEQSVGLELALQDSPSSWLVTCVRDSLPRLRGTSSQIILPSLNDDRQGLAGLLLADFLFRAQTGLSLMAALPEEASRVLELARWYRNGHSVALFVKTLTERLQLRGQLVDGTLEGDLMFNEISEIVGEVMAAHAPAEETGEPHRPTVVVEGITDKYWLEAAAQAHARITGLNLLQGLVIEDAQGADNVLSRVMHHKNMRRPVVGLVDGDTIGIHHAQEGRKVGATFFVVGVPDGFPPPPFGAEPEIEDLAPVELLNAYYAAHTNHQPEVQVIYRGQLRRILPDKLEKSALAIWCSENGTSDDFVELVKLLQKLREQLRMAPPIAQET